MKIFMNTSHAQKCAFSVEYTFSWDLTVTVSKQK